MAIKIFERLGGLTVAIVREIRRFNPKIFTTQRVEIDHADRSIGSNFSWSGSQSLNNKHTSWGRGGAGDLLT